MTTDDRPGWAQRLTREREARNWSQADAVRIMRMHAPGSDQLPDDASMLRQWKRWEAGQFVPSDYYKPVIAAAFGTVTGAFFPKQGKREADAEVLAVSGMDTLEVVTRLQASDVNKASLDALRMVTDRLCSEYSFLPSDQLLSEAHSWLQKVHEIVDGKHLTLSQHRELLVIAGWLALLVGCVEYDLGLRRKAETTRQGALWLGNETDDAEISGWAHEMRAWMALTTGDYHSVVAAARSGTDVAPHSPVAVQLAAQEAKAWARMGDRRQTEVALDQGRRLLEAMPYPENIGHHFVVDPTKFDFYAMDCYRFLAEDNLATTLAEAVISSSTDFDGTERAPMRIAEARITHAVAAAREGDLEQAVSWGQAALEGDRKSLPSLLMASRDLTHILRERYPKEPATGSYLERLQAIAQAVNLARARDL